MLGAVIARRAGREQQERRTQPLAAAAHDVLGHLPDEQYVRVEGCAQHAVDGLHVGADNGLQYVDGHETVVKARVLDGKRGAQTAMAPGKTWTLRPALPGVGRAAGVATAGATGPAPG